MTSWARDFRGASRSLIKAPSYTLIALTTLALGIGASTAIFTVVKAVLFNPLPYPQPERLVIVQENNLDAGFPRFSMSPLNFRDYRAMSSSFEYFAARTGASLALTGIEGDARQLSGRMVTSDFLRVMGIPPAMGRDFGEADDQPDAPRTIILSHGLWQELGGDASVIGRELTVDGHPTTVIGALPPGSYDRVEALVPLAQDYEASSRGSHWLTGFARLKPGVSLEHARSEMATIATTLEETYPDSNTGWGTVVASLRERMVGDVRTALWVLFGSVGLVLLIACANVANLTLARTAQRGRELALRSALGAGRWALVRRMLAESVLLALVAGGLGVLVAFGGTRWLIASEALDLPRIDTVAVDGGVMAFALLVSVATALLFGFMPAFRATGGDPGAHLKEGGRGLIGGRQGQRFRGGLVLAEVALALVVLVGAGLLVRSLAQLAAVEPGFDSEPVWIADVTLPESAYTEDADRAAFYDRLLQEAASLPGVEHVATILPLPLSNDTWVNTFYLEGEPLPEPNQAKTVNVAFASPGYFATMAIPVTEGRPFARMDREETLATVVVNESAAAKFWPSEEALGQRVTFDRPDGEPEGEDVTWFTVVGVVGDVHRAALDDAIEPTVYRSVLRAGPADAAIVARVAGGGDPAVLAGPLRDLITRIDPNLPIGTQRPATMLLDDALAAPRFNTTLLSLFAIVALILASIGVFGVVSYGVSQRLRELGVRVALGARTGSILGLVMRQGMVPVLAGVACGLLVAFAASRVLSSLVYGVGTSDPASFVSAGLVLVAAAAAACLIPAVRAARVDPMRVLRDD